MMSVADRGSRCAIFLLGGWWLVLASCGMLEQRIDRAAGGPSVPADTSVYMKLESLEPSETASRIARSIAAHQC